jgi:methylated-DNA-protein-cysteine methyltransferase-like protein
VDEVMTARSKVTYERIYNAISDIPRGRVATYGQVAELAGIAGQARRIGYALSALPQGSPVPWHRVINAGGGISARSRSNAAKFQRRLLEAEGVVFGKDARVDLARFRWRA